SRELAPSDIDEEKIAHAKVLYIEGYLWDAPDAKAAINKAIAATKRAGHKVALTLSDPFCVGRWREDFLSLWKNDLDILFANEEEAKALFEVEDFDAALQAARQTDGILALTRSEKGCVVAYGKELHVLDAEPVARVVDTTGAGDQFAAGFLYGLTHGQPLDRCGRLGAAAAAEVISHYGARGNKPVELSLIIRRSDAASPRAHAARRDARIHKFPARCQAPVRCRAAEWIATSPSAPIGYARACHQAPPWYGGRVSDHATRCAA